jgi:hypothetical protein
MRTALTAGLLLFALAAPSSADVDVDPIPWSPKVEVRAAQNTAHESRSVRVGSDSKPRLKTHCFYDGQEPDYRCAFQTFPDEEPANQRDLEPGDILTAAREVGMPALKVHIQPGGRTLVNVDTIFFTDPRTLRRTVALLGHAVRLDARPVRFTWVHGDGTKATTSRPGRPYPAKDVTHEYQRPGDDLRARVDTTYRVRYSVDGGGWANLDETLTAPGPAAAIDVDEAAPVLTR